MAEPIADADDIVEAFKEVVGYLHAYRKGALAGPEVGWAIRNFDEACVAVSDERDDG